ncbi:MAG TPA: glycosyltransferase [Chloroflexota bacterium]|nr:glycosyltransferase [Chloroflexota bacterium]
MWRETFRAAGIEAPVFADRFDPHHAAFCRPLEAYRPRPGDLRLLHYTTWSPAAEELLRLGEPVVLMYHNVTPPRFFAGLDAEAERATARGRDELARFAPLCRLATAKSEYSRADLVAAGFRRSAVLPARVDFETLDRERNEALEARVAAAGPGVLTVGRVVPNKRLEDLIKLFAYYRRIEPSARLYCVGAHDERGRYVAGLRWLVRRLGLDGAVAFTGQVGHADRGAYYRSCRVFVTMSEHEGFCVPLVEAMHLGTPVVGYAATAVPETIGDAGVLVREKRPEVIAEAIDLLARDTPLRRRLIEKGRTQAARFAPAALEARFAGLLAEALGV